MPAPFKPSDFKAAIPAASSDMCTKLTAVLQQLPEMLYKTISFIFNEDGTLTDEFKALVGVTSGALAAPSSVNATDGTDATKVTVTWQTVAGATKYDVYRSVSNDTGTAGAPIAVGQTGTSYVDTPPVVNKQYFYWVKAASDTAVSAFSQSDSGYAGSAGAASGLIQLDDTPPGGVFTFPGQDTTSAEIHIWAGGGGGGGYRAEAWGNPSNSAKFGGGGGGGGEYRVITGVTIKANEVLNITIGAGGNPGDCGVGGSGQPGGGTIVQGKNGGGTVATIIQALGGQGGNQGNNQGVAGSGGAGGTGGTGGTGTNGAAGSAGTASTTGGAGGTARSVTISGTPYSAGGGGKGCGPVDPSGGRGKVIIKW